MALFQRQKRREVSPSAPSQALPGTVHNDFLPGAQKRWFETFVRPIIREGKLFLIAVIFGAVSITQAIALIQLIPLKERIPYLAEWDEASGTLREVGTFKPISTENIQQRQVDYHARKWVQWLLTINSQTKGNLEQAAVWVRGAAVNELTGWIKTDRPGERQATDPDYTRTIERKIVITYGQGKTLFLHVELIERKRGVEVGRLNKIVQLDYDLIEDQLRDDNPIGMAIIHFTVGDK